MSYAVLIFDVDGTLAETEEYHRQAFNLAFQREGLSWDWDHTLYLELLSVSGGQERMRHYAAGHDPDFLGTSAADQRIKALHQQKTAFYAEIIASGEVVLRPGIQRLLSAAQASGIRLAISTTTTRDNVENLLSTTLGADGPAIFEAISASDSAELKKPAPDVYFDVLKKLNCGPDACLAFEDSQNGLRSARAAGIDTVVTLSEFTSCEDHADALAVVRDLGDPGQPSEILRGDMQDREFVDLELLNLWRTNRQHHSP